MKLTKHIYIILIALLYSATSYAQGGESALQFASLSHDFGHIREDGGEVQCIFRATNNSNNDISVTGISTSCGCTTTTYTKESIAPHATFELTVTFNPYNRAGRSRRSSYLHAGECGFLSDYDDKPVHLSVHRLR